jgi:tetratricopeptide (TPR) repeat protein
VSADRLLTTAQELSARDGLRAAVLAYMEAVDALVAEKRIAQAQTVMIDLLKAQEKKKGLFGRTDKNPLGSERVTVGLKFAEIAPKGAPTEDALDQLGYLAQDFPDELTIRRANADALRLSGYAADAIDEYRYCAGAVPDDAEVNQHISDLYVGIGRPDDAAGYLLRALRLYGKHGEFTQLAVHAESLIELRPASLGDLIDLLSPAPGDALIGHLNLLDELSHRVMHAGILDAAQKAKAREQLQALYERLVLADRGNEGAARGLETLKEDAAPVERRRSESAAATEAAPSERRRPEPAPVAAPAPVQQSKPSPAPPPAPVPAAAAPAPRLSPVPVAAAPAPAPVVAAPLPPAASAPKVIEQPRPVPVADKVSQPPAQESVAAVPTTDVTAVRPEPAIAAEAPRKSPGAPNALVAYTRRKAKELFDAGDLAGASMCYERLLRGGSDIESLEGALDCYIGLERTQDAARVAVELVNAKADEGDLEGALTTIDRISEISDDANFASRRMELLVALGRPEAVGRQ